MHEERCTPSGWQALSPRRDWSPTVARELPSVPLRAMTTVLVVDDEPQILALVRITLEDEQVRIIEAADGETALIVAQREEPELILLDVRMPKLDGFEVCWRLRQDPRFGQTKIVMLTASGQERDRARGRAAGADDYLTKPFSPLALLSLVQTLLPQEPLWPEP